MPRIFPEYKRSTVYALIGGALHFSLLTLIFFLEFMGLGGENPLSWLVAYWDLPVILMPNYVYVLKIFSGFSKTYLYVGGTFFAAVEGWIVGYVVETFLNWRFKNWGY